MTDGRWDREVDVLVAGTGNGGLTAALCNWEMGCKDILIIEKGSKVRVMAGPLKDMEGIFRGYLRGGQRARVLMEFLRRRSLVEVETELLAVARA